VLPSSLKLSAFNWPVTLAVPVSANVLPSNVKLALSTNLSVPSTYTTLFWVKSVTARVAATTVPDPFGVKLMLSLFEIVLITVPSMRMLSTFNCYN
jgi:hypothetical protein